MDSEPRNFKWMLPGAGICGLLVLSGIFRWVSETYSMRPPLALGCTAALAGLMVVLGLAAFSNWRNYFAWEELERYERAQRAANETPATIMAEALRQMHPEAVRVLNKFGVRTRWGVRAEAEREYILMDANVPMAFVEMVLDRSTATHLMPKRDLAEGAKIWDPDALDTDRDLYDRLQAWMLARMMVTRPWGNSASAWIPPWDPEAVKQTMGLVEAGGDGEAGSG